MSNLAIQFIETTKSYAMGFWGRKQTALDHLNLAVPTQSIFGFLGANGAGKTTSIKMLIGLQFPDSGKIEIFGQPIHLPETKARVGFLPERPYFHDRTTAEEFLNFHRGLYGRYKKEKLPSNQDLLATVGLNDVAGKYLSDYSKGMLQRIGIAQALVNDPDLVILDEPMSGLDPVGRREVRDLISGLAKSGKTVFFSSHILSDVETVCNRIAFLEKGVLKFEGDFDKIRQTGNSKEIVFSSIPEAERKASNTLSKAEERGGVYVLHCKDQNHAVEATREILARNGNLISLNPQHISLEEFLFGKEASK